MVRPSTALALTGTEEPPAPARRLAAGPLEATLRAGGLHHVRVAGLAVLRTVEVLVRDPDWGTPAPVEAATEVAETATGFTVVHRTRHVVGGASLVGTLTLRADATPALHLAWEAVAEGDMTVAKAGFVVLHPAALAGTRLQVRHAAGGVEESRFPERISAQQPFGDIAGLSCEIAPGLWAALAFAGDVFEMEDQRNYTDASFKTYSRPLDLPWPYVIASSATVRQEVRLTFDGPLPAAGGAGAGPAAVRFGGPPSGAMPAVGLAAEPADLAPARARLQVLRAAAPSFLLGRHDPALGHASADLAALGALAQAMNAAVALEAVLPCEAAPEAELAALAAALGGAGIRPRFVTLVPAADLRGYGPAASAPPAPPADRILAAARAALPGIPVGGGTLGDFWLLNLAPPPAGFDHVGHGACAIHHAADDEAALETLATLPQIAASVRALAPGALYRPGPCHLGLRHNAYGGGTAPNPSNRRIPGARQDPRQRGLLGAAFALGTLAAYARAGAASVVPAALAGPLGIAHAPAAEPQPWFDDHPGGVFPLFHVVRGLAAHAGRPLVPVEAPAGLAALALATPAGTELWLANLTPRARDVPLEGAPAAGATLALLDEAAFAAAAFDPACLDRGIAHPGRQVALPPYAIARLAWPV